jgi:hypothetical protein
MQVLHMTPTQNGHQFKKTFQQQQYVTPRRGSVLMSPQQSSPISAYSPQLVHQQMMMQHSPQQQPQMQMHEQQQIQQYQQHEEQTEHQPQSDEMNPMMCDLGLTNNLALYNNLTPRTVATVENINNTFRMASAVGANFVFEHQNSPHKTPTNQQPNSIVITSPHLTPPIHQLNQQFNTSPHQMSQQFNSSPHHQHSPMYQQPPVYPMQNSPIKTEQMTYQHYEQHKSIPQPIHTGSQHDVLGKRKQESSHYNQQQQVRNMPHHMNSYQYMNGSSYPQQPQQYMYNDTSQLVQEPSVTPNDSSVPKTVKLEEEDNPQKRRKMGYEGLRITLPDDEEEHENDGASDIPAHSSTSISSRSTNSSVVSLTCHSLTSSPRFPLNTSLTLSPLAAIGSTLPRLPLPFDGEKELRTGFLLSPSAVFSPSNHGILSLMGVGEHEEQSEGSVAKGVPTPRALDNANTPMSIVDESAANEGFKAATENWANQIHMREGNM